MADFYLDKGHFITARSEGAAFFDEDGVCAYFKLWNSLYKLLKIGGERVCKCIKIVLDISPAIA